MKLNANKFQAFSKKGSTSALPAKQQHETQQINKENVRQQIENIQHNKLGQQLQHGRTTSGDFDYSEMEEGHVLKANAAGNVLPKRNINQESDTVLESYSQYLNNKNLNTSQQSVQSTQEVKNSSTNCNSQLYQTTTNMQNYQQSMKPKKSSLNQRIIAAATMDYSTLQSQDTSIVYQNLFKMLTKGADRVKSPREAVSQRTVYEKFQHSPQELKKAYFRQTSPQYQREIQQANRSVSSRLLEQGQVYKLKREVQQQYKQLEQTTDCSFRPKINKSNSPRRVGQEFINDQDQYQYAKQEKINQYIQNSLDEHDRLLKQKVISSGSAKIFKKVERYQRQSSPTQVSKDLYQLGKEKLQKKTDEQKEIRQYLDTKSSWPQQRIMMSQQSVKDVRQLQPDEEGLFYPKINKQSAEMVRNESVGDILYKNAQDQLLKKEKVKNMQTQRMKSNSQLSLLKSEKTSDKYVLKSLSKEFQDIISQRMFQFYNQDNYIELFEALGFSSQSLDLNSILIKSQLIDILGRYRGKLVSNLFILVAAIMNINAKNQRVNETVALTTNNNNHNSNRKGGEDESINTNHYNNVLLSQHTTNAADDMSQSEYMVGSNTNNKAFTQNKYYISHTTSGATSAAATLIQSILSKNEGSLVLNQKQVALIHQHFIKLYYSRVEYINLQKKTYIAAVKKQQSSQLFSPVLNQNSIKMVEKKAAALHEGRESSAGDYLPIHQVLLQKGAQTLQKRSDSAAAKEHAELDGCSFRPSLTQKTQIIASLARLTSSEQSSQLNNNNSQDETFNSLYKSTQNKSKINRTGKTTEQIEFEKAQNECIFRPNVQRRQSPTNQKQSQKPQSMKQSLGSSSKRSSPTAASASSKPRQNNMFQTAAHNNKHQPSSKDALQQSPVQDEIVYVLEIDLDGQNHSINICECDRPEDVVSEFCEQQNLSDREYQQILLVLKEQIKNQVIKHGSSSVTATASQSKYQTNSSNMREEQSSQGNSSSSRTLI